MATSGSSTTLIASARFSVRSICISLAKASTGSSTKSSARISPQIGGVRGTAFHVWAPNAQRVSVVGDFNDWDGRRHSMRKLLGCGVWEIFLPGVGEGAHYKFELTHRTAAHSC